MKKAFLIIAGLLCLWNVGSADELIATADSLYEHRGDSFDTETQIADSAEIDLAIDLYRQAMESSSYDTKVEATWKLLRAYYFKGNFTTDDKELKKRIYDDGKKLGVESLEHFPESAGINLWTAILYGVWAEEYGKLKAAREGAAGKIRDYCQKAIQLDSLFGDAGGYRILGRVHFKSPKIPFILGWPSKEKSQRYLERAIALAPDNLYGKQYLAEVLYERDQKDKAISLVQEVVVSDNNSLGIAETARVKKESTEILEKWLKD